MQRFYIFLFVLLLAPAAMAQSYNLKGKLSSEDGTGLPAATVLLLNATDSMMVNYALSNNRGEFEIKNIRQGDYLLRLSYMGFRTITLALTQPEGNVLDLGEIKLPEESTLLREVIVEQERIPMRVRNDTIEYDAMAFKPLPNEMVEDLLKRMPGIVVSADGSVEAQGETVRRVLVDGKEFFGRDPKMATQNLPADAVAKVHVFDQRSEQAQFTGIDDGQRERTMNLELKEDRKEAAFGNTSLGWGPESFFQGRANYNRFDSKGQISFIGMGNNLNQQGFSIGDYLNFTGGTRSMASGQGLNIQRDSSIPINFDGSSASNGLMTSYAAGLNVNRNITKKTEINASYFFNQLEHDMTQELERENFLPAGSYNSYQNQLQDNQNFNHRVNLKVDHTFNESSSLLFTGNTSFNKTDTYLQTSSRTFNTEGGIQNTGDQISTAEGQNLDASGSLLWRQRLTKPGRTLTSNLDFSIGNNDQEAHLNAINRYYHLETPEEHILQDQLRTDVNSSVAAGFTYTEPLGNRFFLETNYQALYRSGEVDQRVYDVPGENEDGEFNVQMSNHYRNIYTYHQGGLNLLLNRERYNITLGGAIQSTQLEGRLISLDEEVNRDYLSVLPVARFNYNFTNFRRLMAHYETNVQEPTALQLQPVVDNRDPLNLYAGNSGLRPAYRHRWQVRYNSFNPATSFGYFAFANAEYTTNAIANSVIVDENLVRTTMPVNVGNNLSLRGSLNLNFAVNPIKSRFMIGTSINRRESVNVLNEESQDIINNTLTGNLRYIFRPADAFELRLTANLNNQITRYEFSNNEQAFLNQSYRADVNWQFLKTYRFEAGYNYQMYEGRTTEFDRNIPMLDMSLSRSFLRNNAGELKFSVFNLLDQDLGVTQSQSVNYYQSTVTNSLGRYFMLTFTYALNRQLNMMDRGPGGGRGMRMIVH